MRVRFMTYVGMPPLYGSTGAAGADLCAVEEACLMPGERKLIPTGLRVAIPEGFVGLIWPRSGLALKRGIDVLAGVIDSDYRGEIGALLVNHGEEPVQIRHGDRVAQLLIQRVERAVFERVQIREFQGETERGAAGFGSTGR